MKTTLQTTTTVLGPLLGLGLVTLALLAKGSSTMTSTSDNTTTRSANRLAGEQSPYLLQHVDNPVDWYPWGDEAFEKAEREDKPVFLSIGYSTCHWCHVMEHESFEDEEVARLMNEAFVSIKVDREERPDIDGVYMTVCQMMTGGGGWPLTIIMTPDKRPFFAGTYIPKETRFGRMGMLDLIPRVQDLWKNRRDDVLESAEKVTSALTETTQIEAGGDLDASTLSHAARQLAHRYDDRYGGFGEAPKFPTPHQLLFLLRQWKRTDERAPLDMVDKTLTSMRRGGIYDHVGFGFHRYATDRHWLVPHFEKMLYDQAMLTIASCEAFQATGQERHATTAREIITYVLRDMTSPEGGFYSAEDADSEGVEGKFYVWTADEIRQVLDDDLARIVIQVYGVTGEGNYVDEASGKRTGTNILHRTKSVKDLAAELDIAPEALQDKLEQARQKLFEVRERRMHPHKDDKILTDWNGLMIAALARAGFVLADPAHVEAAEGAAEFVLTRLRSDDGRLLHRYRGGEAGLTAHVDDYAFMVWGLIELYEATFDARHLESAIALNQEMLDRYWDDQTGGLYFTADNAERLLIRQKDIYDGAIPSGNSVAMLNLLRLARITGQAEFEQRADRIAKAFASEVARFPSAYTMLLCGVDFAVGPSREIVIAGLPTAEDTRSMLSMLRRQFLPNKVLLCRPADDEEAAGIVKLAPWTEGLRPIDGKATGYVCVGQQCSMPVTTVHDLARQIAD